MASTIRIGTASPATQASTAETLDQLSAIAHKAASTNIDILLLPEAYIGGYPHGTTFGSVMGDRTREGRQEYANYFAQAVDLGDTVGDGAGAALKWVRREVEGAFNEGGVARGDGTREILENIARDTGVFLVLGLIEKAGGSLYCAAVYVCPREGIIGKRRKILPTAMERLVWAQGSPSTLKAVSTTIRGTRINLVAALCWENYMPLLRQSLYNQNVNLWLTPTNDDGENWLPLVRSIAFEGRCFLMSSTMCKRDPDHTGEDSGEKRYFTCGGSCIIGPYSNILAGPQWEDADNLIYADVDFQECIRGRLDLDVAGSYSRHDSFKLHVEGLDMTPLPY